LLKQLFEKVSQKAESHAKKADVMQGKNERIIYKEEIYNIGGGEGEKNEIEFGQYLFFF